ncbi:MAG: hypothetical protein JWM59_177 [Verrucomicrobiales bacterium]|nr:hypothetical protein [Verrucomicrobiales bacterium]
MDQLEADPPDSAADAPPARPALSSRARRARKKSRGGLWLGITGGLAVVAACTVFSLQSWMESYLRSPAFAQKINDAALSALHAQGSLDGMGWQSSTVHAARFHAQGLEGAAFQELSVFDARAEVDIGALWDRAWRVKRISLARVEADFSPGRVAGSGDSPSRDETGTGSGKPAPGWLQRWLPNRTEMGPVVVDRFDFRWRSGGENVQGEQITLRLTPNPEERFTTVSGSGGTVKTSKNAHVLTVRSLQAVLRKDTLELEQFQGEIAGAPVRAEGSLAMPASGGNRSLSLNVTLEKAQLADWIPDNWLRRCSGLVSVKAKLQASGEGFSHYDAAGRVRLEDTLVQALPLLEVIAKKTRNETFLRLQLKDAVSDFSRLPDGGWRLDRLRADAPGLLRLKGSAAADATGALNGDLLLGIVPGTLRYLAGAEQTVFLPMERAALPPAERAMLASDDSGLLWTRLRLRGTLDQPSEDLSDRLAKAWFNATAEEVSNLSMEAAAKAAETAGGLAGQALDIAPPVLNRAPDLLQQGVKSGLNVLDGLLPR